MPEYRPWKKITSRLFGSSMAKTGEAGEESPMIKKTDDEVANYSGTEEKTYDLSPQRTKRKSSLRVSTGPESFSVPTPTVTPLGTPTSVYSDSDSEITFGRRIARKISNAKFLGQLYDGSKGKPGMTIQGSEEEGRKERYIEPPRLDKGWEYFEHFILPRCFDERTEDINGRKYVRAGPGEKEKTRLYPVVGTPLEDMADFGIGVGMYFAMVKFFAVVALIAGFMSIPSILFYANDFSKDGKVGLQNPLNKGTAICTNTTWQPCPDCKPSDLDSWPAAADDPKRIIQGLSPDGQNNVTFILTNGCDINETFSAMNLATLFFFAASTLLFMFLQRALRARLDEGEQTTSDYSIHIKNPPFNSKDPDVWKIFFETTFEDVHVTVCTVVLDNEALITKLARRRTLLTQLKNKLPPQIAFCSEDLEMTVLQCPEPGFLQRLVCCKVGPKEIYDKVQVIEREIEMGVGKVYSVSGVFITFETEEMQRRVLEEMSFPKLFKNDLNEKYKFEGHVLNVNEPDEPSSIRWKDLDEKPTTRIMQRLCTFLATLILVIGGGVLIAIARGRSVKWAAIIIVILNALSPAIVKKLTALESHANETTYASSTYIKVTLLRWVNTVIITAIISPFVYTAQDGDHLIESIRILFTAELLQRPILQFTDLLGNIKRHIFASRAKDQGRMNLLFSSKEYSVGERYTDVTKLLFLTCFYATIYPPAWFFAAATLFIYYWIDKFCVLRTWRQGPKVNGKISVYSTYFFLLCVVAYSVMSTYNIGMFPFDNACETDEKLPDYYIGPYGSGDSGIQFTISENEKVYKFCQQDLFRYLPSVFPPFPSDINDSTEWMSSSQMKFLPIYAWSCVGIVLIVSMIVFIKLFIAYGLPLCFRSYKSQGKLSEKYFSEVDEIKGYIPCIDIPGHQFPHLLCDTKNVGKELIGWQVPDSEDINAFNVTFDLAQILRRTQSKKVLDDNNVAFSKVMHWPPISEKLPINIDSPRDDSMVGSLYRFFFQ